MLKKITNAVKGVVTGAVTAVAGKVAETSWGKEALKKEIEKMPMPPQAKQMFLKLVENRPDLLTKIAEETQVLIASGKNQMSASQSVMMKYQQEIRAAITGK